MPVLLMCVVVVDCLCCISTSLQRTIEHVELHPKSSSTMVWSIYGTETDKSQVSSLPSLLTSSNRADVKNYEETKE